MAASGATLDGKALNFIPKGGVIDYVNKNGKDAASWQPQPEVRQAMVGIRAAKISISRSPAARCERLKSG